MIINVEYKDKSMEKLKHVGGKNRSNAIDLYTAEEVTIYPGEYKLIKTNVAMKLPEGYKADIKPRSSTFKKYGLLMTNSPGLVDTSYGGTDDIWGVPVYAPIQANNIIEILTGYNKAMDRTRIHANKAKVIKERFTKNHNFVEPIIIPKGTKLVQFEVFKVMEDVEFNEVEKLGNDNRGCSNLSIEKESEAKNVKA